MVYLDNAATTFPKPTVVAEAVYRCINEYCGNPGRGSHYLARAASEKLFEARSLLTELFGLSSAENVIFTLNTTYALNMAVKSAVTQGCHVLISDMEHNSVLRPVEALKRKGVITYSVFKTFGGGDSDKILKSINENIRQNTRVLVCQHSSNICGTVLPIKKIGELCRERGIFFIVDAAQSAGLFDISVGDFDIDALCVPSHKGLYGPQGAGVLMFSDRLDAERLATLVEGGSGIASRELIMPSFLPDRFEAGTMATPVIAGLCEGINFVRRNTPASIRAYEEYLSYKFKDHIGNLSDVTLYDAEKSSSIVLFNLKGKSSSDVSEALDKFGICVRSGLHCAPLAHKTLGTPEGGAVRVSFGAFNSINDVRLTADVINRLVK